MKYIADRRGRTIKKISHNEMEILEKEVLFYNFRELEAQNSRGILVKFKEGTPSTTYSDLYFGESEAVYLKKKRKLFGFTRKLFQQLAGEDCIVRKYEEKWLTNPRISRKLCMTFQNNLIDNTYTDGFEVKKSDEIIYQLFEAILKYNSFVQFLFPEAKVIVTPTDHMDIFVHAEDIGGVKAIISGLLMESKYSDLCFEISCGI